MPRTRKDTESSSDSDSGPDDRTPAKKAKKDNEDGDAVFDLDKTRRLTVRSFKGKVLVDIREFYLKDGNLAPGKKGIALSVEQWKKLVEYTDEINDAIKEK